MNRDTLINKIATAMAESDAGIDCGDEEQLHEFGENSFFGLKDEFANQITDKTDEELEELREKFL